ncbi:MAG: YopX family protein [Candidatus Micrarchaeia archaeon]|jgi:hypothetical protein
MRQTKFRGIEIGTNIWRYGHHIVVDGESQIYDRGGYYIVIPETVGEWTGRVDRNDKDIYEDDEVNFLGNKERSYTCGLPEICRVVWFEESSGWMLTSEKHSFGLYKTGIYEVIGNIHDKAGEQK